MRRSSSLCVASFARLCPHFMIPLLTSLAPPCVTQRHARNTFGHIDVVAVNAGIAESSDRFLNFAKTDNGEPVKPRMPTVDVNIVGAGYTTKLAFFHLRENPAKEGKAVVILGSMGASASSVPTSALCCSNDSTGYSPPGSELVWPSWRARVLHVEARHAGPLPLALLRCAALRHPSQVCPMTTS